MKNYTEAANMIEKAQALVSEALQEQQDVFDDKSEKWQESDVGQEAQERLDKLQEIIDVLEAAVSDLSGLEG